MAEQVTSKVDTEMQIVSFKMGSEEYGVNIEQVREINRIAEIVKVPKAPHFVEGIINLRGSVTAIIDLRKRFDIKPTADKEQERIIVVEVQGRMLGVVVDAVLEVTRLATSCIDDVPPSISGFEAKFLAGVAKLDKRLIILLDLDAILSIEELRQIDAL